MVDLNKAIVNYIENFSRGYKNKKILDIGCGRGDYTFFFGKENKTIGIDLQDVVKKRYFNFDFQVADAIDLPFGENVFDLVISFDVIEHIKNGEKILSEAHRVLKRNGQIFFSTPNKNRLSHFLLEVIGKPVKYPLDLGVNQDLGPITHVKEYTAKELSKLMRKAGFREIKIIPFWFGLTYLHCGFRNVPIFLQKYCQYLFVEATSL